MNQFLSRTVIVLLSFLVALPAVAQESPGQGSGGGGSAPGMMGGGMMGGMMGHGMMGSHIAPDVPAKLPAPKNQEWVQRLRDVLALEHLSYVQYTSDAQKFNAHMPYSIVIGQEQDHIRTIERLFATYGLPADSQEMGITETRTLNQALELCVKMEQDLAQRYAWLVKNAGDSESAAIINELLLQTRQHAVMFRHALSMGGSGMGAMHGGMGPGMMR